jgi:hypothetical protein
VRTSHRKELVNPPNPKMQYEMHTNFIFNELGLVGKLTTSSRTSQREIPISNKVGRIKVCKGLISLR